MLQPPPIPIGFLIHDLKWSTSLEGLRAHPSDWQTLVLSDWSDLLAWAARETCSLSIVEVELADPGLWMRRFSKLSRLRPDHRSIVVGSNELRPQAGLFHELGVIACGFSVGESPRLTRMIEQFVRSRPSPALGLRESIYRSLPWPNAAIKR